MNLYLFGGHSPETVDAHYQVIGQLITELRPSQLLCVMTAHTDGNHERHFEVLKERLNLRNTQLLNASNPKDLARAETKYVYVDGGHGHEELRTTILCDPQLAEIVLGADHYFGDSAGAMLAGEWQRKYKAEITELTQGLALLKSTIIEPHYTKKHSEARLREEVTRTECQFGLGIDEAVGLITSTERFPKARSQRGTGVVELIINRSGEIQTDRVISF